MMRLKFLLLALVLLGTTLVLPRVSGAASPASISIGLAPENPSPKETVVITLQSYLYNLDSVPISWAVDGKTAAVGVGKKTFSAVAPDAGREVRISATIALPEESVEKTVVIRPAVMALLWQANDSYVPPFYRGKALPILGSEIKVVAIPEIKSGFQVVNPKNMVYSWKKDYANEAGASGYGKNFYTYTTDYLEASSTINVAAATTDQKYSSSGNLSLSTFEPEILFYRVDPEMGILWEKALADGHVIAGEEVIAAAPYFISPKEIRIPSLSWDWSINGTYVAVPVYKPNFLPVQAQPGASGISDIKLEISNKYNLLMSAKKELRVQF